MSKIISLHAFRGGTGRSTAIANIAGLMVAKGLRVGVVDIDLETPGIHALFGLREEEIERTVNGFLWQEYTIMDAVYTVTQNLGVNVEGELFLVPASMNPEDIARGIEESFDANRLSDGFDELIDELQLDLLFVDTHAGLEDDTLLSIAVSDMLLVTLRPDQQDYQGTHLLLKIARRLQIPALGLLVNQIPSKLDTQLVRTEVEKVYQLQIKGLFPYSSDMMTMASSAIFALHYPHHPLSSKYRQLVELISQELKINTQVGSVS